MACLQRSHAKEFERPTRVVGIGIVEVEQIDFTRRVEGNIGPACCIFGSIVTLMHPNFADGDIHLVEAAGWCIGHRHTDRAGLCRSPTTSSTAAAASGEKTSQ